MTRIAFLSDIHYPEPDAVKMIIMASNTSPDYLVLNGDFISYANNRLLEKLVKLLERYIHTPMVAVLGNHEHYLSKKTLMRKNKNSLEAAYQIATLLEDIGISVLDLSDKPLNLGGVWLSGCIGWYDYSLAPEGYSDKDFDACNPYGYSLRNLELCVLKNMHYLCPEWWRNDCIYVRLPFSHAEYVSKCLEKVWRQLSQAKEPKILVYHHVPRREVIEYTGTIDDFDFAYAGSTRLDEPVRKYNIKYVIYGHLHSRSKQRIMKVQNTLYANAYPLYREQKGILLLEHNHHGISLTVH